MTHNTTTNVNGQFKHRAISLKQTGESDPQRCFSVAIQSPTRHPRQISGGRSTAPNILDGIKDPLPHRSQGSGGVHGDPHCDESLGQTRCGRDADRLIVAPTPPCPGRHKTIRPVTGHQSTPRRIMSNDLSSTASVLAGITHRGDEKII